MPHLRCVNPKEEDYKYYSLFIKLIVANLENFTKKHFFPDFDDFNLIQSLLSDIGYYTEKNNWSNLSDKFPLGVSSRISSRFHSAGDEIVAIDNLGISFRKVPHIEDSLFIPFPRNLGDYSQYSKILKYFLKSYKFLK